MSGLGLRAVWTLLVGLCAGGGLFVVHSLEEGEPCSHNRLGVQGICTFFRDCASAIEERKKDIDPESCGFRPGSLIPNVCCVSKVGDREQTPRPGAAVSIATRKCEEYVTYVRRLDDGSLTGECPSPPVEPQGPSVQKLIVNGDPAFPKEFPHMVLLGYGEPNDISYSCGGTLISPQFILTAAHCVTHPNKGWVRWAKLGELNRSTEMDDARPEVLEVRQSDVIRHPLHRARSRYHDIALLKLNQSAAISQYVRPACLHTDPRPVPGTQAIVSGWGTIGYAEDPSDILLKAGLTLFSNEKCNDSFVNDIRSNGSSIPRGIIEGQICAGSKTGKDACQGDSGGPLQLFTPESPYCMYHVVGVVSFGKSCGTKKPGVYTRVSSYLPWIEENVWPNSDG